MGSGQLHPDPSPGKGTMKRPKECQMMVPDSRGGKLCRNPPTHIVYDAGQSMAWVCDDHVAVTRKLGFRVERKIP